MLPLPDCDAICLIYSFCLPEAVWLSAHVCVCEYTCEWTHTHLCFYTRTMLWHYPQKYTVVPVKKAHPLFHMKRHTAPVCPRRTFPFVIQEQINNSKGWLSIIQQASPFPSLPIMCSESGVAFRYIKQPRCRCLWWLVHPLFPLSPLSGQAGMWQRLSISPQLRVRGALVQGLTDGSASIKPLGKDESEKSTTSHPSTKRMTPKSAIHRLIVWQICYPVAQVLRSSTP